MSAGAAAGRYAVKSCGNAHAWCAKCRPEIAEGQRKPKPAPGAGLRPCRNCGRCDTCLGIEAPEGTKRCRECGETKPLSAFQKRTDAGGHRNQCRKCRNGGVGHVRCATCPRWFTRKSDDVTRCSRCRPKGTRPCVRCGAAFTASVSLRIYCSAQCREAALAEKRAAAYKVQRTAALRAYGGPEPACVCCGEREPVFLALDHINGGGNRQHRELGGGGFYAWLRKNNYPVGFRVLCHNCNLGRELNGGICPHL